jgi:hypothetical protein
VFYLLILWIGVGSGFHEHGPIQQLGPFATQDACQAAGTSIGSSLAPYGITLSTSTTTTTTTQTPFRTRQATVLCVATGATSG